MNYRTNITLTFILFAFFIVISTTSVVMFYWTKLSTQNFQNRVLFESKNILSELNQKKDIAKNSALGIKEGVFSLTPNKQILATIFKTFLYANKDFIQISYINNDKEFFCKKSNIIFCNQQKYINNKKPLILYTKIATQNNSYIQIQTTLSNFFHTISNDIFKLIITDKNGKILWTNFIKSKSIFDIFNHQLAKSMIKQSHKFITNDIYVLTYDNYKFIFIQNKKLLHKQKQLTKKLAITMLIISIILSIIFGYIFSKPLYQFYEELDKRVKEEIEKNREKEQMLMHQSKLASLGEMLGNIAHQWRHPITRLSLLIQNFEMAYKMNKIDDKFVNKFKTKALEQINYMSNTIDDFTNFFKKDKEKQIFYIEEVINNALVLLEGRLKNINIKKEINNIKINGYKTEFSQVILNILNNAIDILNERNIQNKQIYIKVYNNIIEIEDNAGGIHLDNIQKVFEPYFTTKFQSQGTGIGLYMSKIIITKHFNSKLEVQNTKNGALFKIILDHSIIYNSS